MTKTPGQIAYEMDVAANPLYPDGSVRRPWDRISDVARQVWESAPMPRLHPGKRSAPADSGQ